MPNDRPKVKTAVIQLRVDPQLKAAATDAAKKDHRNLTNWIEVLILNRCNELDIPTGPKTSKEHSA